MSQKKKVWLALCLVIPAGIAFAEEEVIIIEEPVAAEEVVEEVVEVEPVEEDIQTTASNLIDRANVPQRATEILEPTCTEPGSCMIDGVAYIINPLGHLKSFIILDATDMGNVAKCGAEAVKVYYCARKDHGCDNCLLDKDGKETEKKLSDLNTKSYTSDEDAELKTPGVDYEHFDYLQHDFRKETVKATCTTKNGYDYKCERCGLIAIPTTSSGSTDSTYVKLTGKDVTIDAAEQAKMNETTGLITPNGATTDPNNHAGAEGWDDNKHTWKFGDESLHVIYDTNRFPDAVAPTCQDNGVGYVICNKCGQTIRVDVPAVDHTIDPEKYIILTKATCTTPGMVEYPCKYCGLSIVVEEIAATGHKWSDTNQETGPFKWVKGPTWKDAKGDTWISAIIKCTVCNETHFEQYDDGTSGTAWDSHWTTSTKPKDCTELYVGAEHQNVVVLPAVAATATEPGLTEGKYCDVCGTVITQQKVVPPLSAGLVKNKETDEWEYQVNGEQDKEYVGLVTLSGEQFFVRNGTVATEVNGIQQPDPVDGTWYFFANGQVQKGHPGFALYDGAWFYINEYGVLDEDAYGYYKYDGAYFLVTGGWVRTDYTGVFPNEGNDQYYYINSGKFMEDFTGSVVLDGITYDVVEGIATPAK